MPPLPDSSTAESKRFSRVRLPSPHRRGIDDFLYLFGILVGTAATRELLLALIGPSSLLG